MFNFGAYIGIVFPELNGYSDMEIFVYYLQHLIASGVGTLVLSLSGRFDILAYRKVGYYVLGLMMFSIYMRPVLTPLSLLTWANLNHCLCGTATDPFWLYLDLGKWYYVVGEFYLSSASILLCAFNFGICYFVKRLLLRD